MTRALRNVSQSSPAMTVTALSITQRSLHVALLVASLSVAVRAHEHHNDDALSEENLEKPIDMLLWLHILVQILTWGFMFPIGMVLGLSR